MSTPSEPNSPASELDLDLHFLPAWAQKPPTPIRYDKFDREREDDRSDRRGGGRGMRRDDRGERRGGPGAGRGPQGPGRGRPEPGNRQGGAGFRPRRGRPEDAAEQAPALELSCNIIPDDQGVDSLARQIRLTGRAYPLFDIANLILKKPDRYRVSFTTIKKPDGQVAQPLFVCSLDDTIWTSEHEAVRHILQHHFATFYQVERVATEAPKGTYTFVAQCGISGVVLGPPNYHDYQNKLRKLHAERFSRMPFETFKARVKIVKDPDVVKRWLEEQSFKNEYICLNLPEPLKLHSMEEVERHFRETHQPVLIRQIDSWSGLGTVARELPCAPLRNLARRTYEDQSRWPLKVVNVLSQQFANRGLQFFKVDKVVTHVAVARPKFLDVEVTPVSDGVLKIVNFISQSSQTTRRKLLEALVPASLQEQDSKEDKEAPPSPEVAAVISDLHWLIHEGHVIEFANGNMEMAKKPAPRPVKEPRAPKPKPAAATPESPSQEEASSTPQAASEQPGSEAAAPETNASVDAPAEAPSEQSAEAPSEQPSAPTQEEPRTEDSAQQTEEPSASAEQTGTDAEAPDKTNEPPEETR